MTKPVVLAGLLGGLLGGIAGFALTRALPAAAPKPVAEPPHEARALADDLLAKLAAGKTEEFVAAHRAGYPEFDDAQFDAAVRQPLLAARPGFAERFGGAGEFEYIRTAAPVPGLVRFVYLERFPRGNLVWLLLFHRGPDGWIGAGFQYKKLEAAFDLLK